MSKQQNHVLLCTLEGRGGVGKTLISHLLYSVLRAPKGAGFDRTINSRNSTLLTNQSRLLGNRSRSAKRPN